MKNEKLLIFLKCSKKKLKRKALLRPRLICIGYPLIKLRSSKASLFWGGVNNGPGPSTELLSCSGCLLDVDYNCIELCF